MTYVITDACIGAKHTHCVDVCPVNAFREGAEMLYIDPDVCINCNACLMECPEQAIFPEDALSEADRQFIAINALESKKHPAITESYALDAQQTQADVQQKNNISSRRFAVVGAGPSGFYSCEALLKHYPDAQIDLIDKLPTPFGLVRFGVAPDHPEIKSVAAQFTQLLQQHPNLKFFGNVNVGQDIDRDTLLSLYDAVIYSTGASQSKPLAGVAHQQGVYGSAEFVAWYNGHPDQTQLQPNLAHDTLSIIGMGNVALDIARILCLPQAELARIDIAEHALNALAQSQIKQVNIIARRSPIHAAFTPKELKQLIQHPQIQLEVDAEDLAFDEATLAMLELPEYREAKENISLLRSILTRPPTLGKTIRFIFHRHPKQVYATSSGEFSIECTVNQSQFDAQSEQLVVEATTAQQLIDSGMIITATGYKGQAIKGIGFDAKQGTINHQEGRVQLENGELSEKEYVAGWIKRGANGVIGTNKQCAYQTVKSLVVDLSASSALAQNSDRQSLKQYLSQQGVQYFSFADWLAIDQHEKSQGMTQNRPRHKLIDLQQMHAVRQDYRDKIAKAQHQHQDQGQTQARAVVKPFDRNQAVQQHYRTCTLCEAMCGIVVDYQGEQILSIAGDPQDQHSSGHICPKGYALQDLHNDPDRLKTPKKRIGEQWVDMDWDEAFDEVAQRLVAVQKQYGNDAVAAYWGNPTSHNFEVMMHIGSFKKALKSKNMYSASSLDQMPHMLTSLLMYGHSMNFTIPDIDRTDYMLMLGANPAASNGSLMTAGNVLERLERIKQRGGKLVLIDPRRTETARYASEHVFIQPGRDALFLLGLLQVIFDKGLVNASRRLPFNGNIDDIRPLVSAIPLETIATLTHISVADIERIATEFAQAEHAVCYGRMGFSTQEFGALNHWLIQLLNIVTNNLDREGGMMFTTPAIDMTDFAGRGSFASFHSRVRKLPEFNRELPSATLADEMLTEGEGQVKAFVVTAGNPVLSTPNGARLEQALANLDFMVAIDFYINETTRHADIILPPTGPFEHGVYDLVFTNLAVRNVARYSPALFKQKSYMRSDGQIYSALIERIEQLKLRKPSMLNQLKLSQQHKVKSLLNVERVIDLGLRHGRYGNGWKGLATGQGLNLKKLKQYRHGLDLGALQPRIPEKLFTKDKKIQLFPAQFLQDLERLQAFVDAQSTAKKLTLIGRRDLRTNNSWMHNSQRLVKGKNRCDLYMHPQTAKDYGIVHQEQVYISSDVGALKVTVSLTEDIMPNVVSLPHGWGHHRQGMQMSIASANPGVSMNDLTDQSLVDELSGNAVLNGLAVEVQKIYSQ